MDEADAILTGLAHADDPAAADRHPRLAHFLQRIQSLLERPRGDDVAVMLGRGVDVVVVIVEPGLGERPRLIAGQHAESHAGFEAHRLHFADHLAERGHVAVLRLTPRRAHAEALRAVRLGLAGGSDHGVGVHQFFGLQTGVGIG